MKMIQSFWSCNCSKLDDLKSGWYAPEYNLMSTALSCLQLNRFYSQVTLYADSFSARLLLDELQLPYTELICKLDELNDYNPQLWALPKIYAYSQQTAPFLHVDNDVLIWEPFDTDLLTQGLIAQNQEAATDYYESLMKGLEKGLSYFPPAIIADRNSGEPMLAYNAGIFGGSDVDFFRAYASQAFAFVRRNLPCLSKINVNGFNIFFEQYLFHCLVKKERKQVSLLLPEVFEDNQYVGFGDFEEVPHQKTFLHLLGTFKRQKAVCGQLANSLRQEYPEYYYKIIELCKRRSIPLKKDYYYAVPAPDQRSMVNKYRELKNGYLTGSLSAAVYQQSCPLTDNPQVRTRYEKEQINYANTKPLTEVQSCDWYQFRDNLHDILTNKYHLINNDYLYGRDLNHHAYFNYIFRDQPDVSQKLLVFDSLIEIIESEFNWMATEQDGGDSIILSLSDDDGQTQYYNAVIPECDRKGYSLVQLDELDMVLLNNLKHKVSIGDLLRETMASFDSREVDEFYQEYEQLILGRLKSYLGTKIVKAIYS